jgi:hypothetical protein
MKYLLVFLGILGLAIGPVARAEGPDEQYLRIYGIIQQADELAQTGQGRAAFEKYQEAQTALKALAVVFPEWKPNLVQFRQSYIAQKLANFGAPSSAAAAPKSLPIAPPPERVTVKPPAETPVVVKPLAETPAPADLQNQLKNLTEQVQRLSTDKSTLEAKLREALSVHPAAVDPGELAKAEERIRGLLKENDLLKVSLKQEQDKVANAANASALQKAQEGLMEANRKLTAQSQAIIALNQEKELLQARLKQGSNSSEVQLLQAQNEALRGIITDLKTNKTVAAPAITSAPSSSEVQLLKAENEALRALVANLKTNKTAVSALPAIAPPSASSTEFQLLKAENESLKEIIGELRAKKTPADQPAVKPAPSTSAEPSASRADAKQVKQLQNERDDLQKKLAAANQALAKSKTAKDTPKGQDLANQVNALQAKLAVLEAKKVPYSPEELALLKTAQPDAAPVRPAEQAASPKTTNTNANASFNASTGPTNANPSTETKRTINDIPVGAGTLVAEAQRAFAMQKYEEAEKIFQQVLNMDEKNVWTLGNLAASQLERGHLEDAEKNLQKALAQEPNDAFNLSLWGILKFRQNKFPEALDALSRSAKLDPKNAETQNYLGITLSQEGQRDAAEAALRKALQLDPRYASAHLNLAIVYATQNPPYLSLARYHYQKAIALNHARNPELEKVLGPSK